VKKDDLIPYHKHPLQLFDRLETVKLKNVPRSTNKMANGLQTSVTTLALEKEENITIPVCGQWVVISPKGKC